MGFPRINRTYHAMKIQLTSMVCFHRYHTEDTSKVSHGVTLSSNLILFQSVPYRPCYGYLIHDLLRRALRLMIMYQASKDLISKHQTDHLT